MGCGAILVNTKFMHINNATLINKMPFSGYLTPQGSYHTRFGDNDCNQWQPDVNTMAVPTYEELLAHCKVGSSLMEQTFSDDHLMEFGSRLDEWEKLALSLKIPCSEIEEIKSQGGKGMKGIRLLQCWKQRQGSMATYKALVEALLQISRTDFAEKVVALPQSLQRDGVQSSLSLNKSGDLTAPTLPATPNEYEVISTLKELEEEFYDLVIHIEDTLENSKVSLNTITRRFRMLPQSVRRQHETDENYIATRQKILDSKTIKKLFDNLTELKHWNYMTPDTLAHVVKDVKIDDVHRKINEYKDKLATFKANIKLRELIGISFPVPDYCMELTMKIEGWAGE